LGNGSVRFFLLGRLARLLNKGTWTSGPHWPEPTSGVQLKEIMMAPHTAHETFNLEAKPSTWRKALLVAEWALVVILGGVLFNTIENNLIPISAEAAPKDAPSAPAVVPHWGPADTATTTVFAAETWYTPAQSVNQATEAEVLPSQF
jgi:hypothetical protein